MAYGHWSGARGAQNEEEMEGILTKGFTTKGVLVEGLRLRCFLFMVHHSWEASLVADSRLGVLKRHHRVHAVLYKVLTGLGKWCAAAVAMELELNSCDGEKLSWG
jgi:hypothetical protein